MTGWDNLDPDLFYEECGVCEGYGEDEGDECVWCDGTGLVEHNCETV